MYPEPVHAFGVELDIWNVFFLIGVGVGYMVLLFALRIGTQQPRPRWLPLRWIVTVYLGAVLAQLFAYLFDLNTSLRPPPSVSLWRYYLDPLFGPKTLYGAVVSLPLGIAIIAVPWTRGLYSYLLERWTPAMMATLGVSRIGCFFQGCCYGRRDDVLGTVFATASPVYYRQLNDGVITAGALPLPVVATQAMEAAVLIGLCSWCLWAIRRGRSHVFADSVAVYSLARFAMEFLRDDPERNALGPLASSQWIALVILAIYTAWRLRPSVAARAPASLSPR